MLKKIQILITILNKYQKVIPFLSQENLIWKIVKLEIP